MGTMLRSRVRDVVKSEKNSHLYVEFSGKLQLSCWPCHNFDNARRIDRTKLAKSLRTKRCKMTVGHGKETQMARSVLFPLPPLSRRCRRRYILSTIRNGLLSLEKSSLFPHAHGLIYTNIASQNGREVMDRAMRAMTL